MCLLLNTITSNSNFIISSSGIVWIIYAFYCLNILYHWLDLVLAITVMKSQLLLILIANINWLLIFALIFFLIRTDILKGYRRRNWSLPYPVRAYFFLLTNTSNYMRRHTILISRVSKPGHWKGWLIIISLIALKDFNIHLFLPFKNHHPPSINFNMKILSKFRNCCCTDLK